MTNHLFQNSAIILLLFFILFPWSFLAAMSLVMFFDKTMPFFSLYDWCGTIIFILILLWLNRKQEAIQQNLWKWVLVLYVLLIVAITLGITFCESRYWFLKYSISIFIGILASFKKSSYLEISIVTIANILICEHAEYFRYMDTVDTPNLITSYVFPTYDTGLNLPVRIIFLALVALLAIVTTELSIYWGKHRT